MLSNTLTGPRVKYLLFLSNFNATWIFSTDLSKKYSNIKSFRWEQSCFTRSDGQTDMMQLLFTILGSRLKTGTL